MSAFVCNPEHVKELAIFAASTRSNCHGSLNVDPRYIRRPEVPELDIYDITGLATFYADVLWQQNVRSVQTRYPDDTWESLPGPVEKPEHLAVTARDIRGRCLRPEPVAILKMVDCLEYQSCESEDWPTTLAHDILQRIRRAAIVALPGYEDAPWEYSRPTPKPRQHSLA